MCERVGDRDSLLLLLLSVAYVLAANFGTNCRPPTPHGHKGNYRPSLILLLKSLRVKFSQINTLQNFSPSPDRHKKGLKNIRARPRPGASAEWQGAGGRGQGQRLVLLLCRLHCPFALATVTGNRKTATKPKAADKFIVYRWYR